MKFEVRYQQRGGTFGVYKIGSGLPVLVIGDFLNEAAAQDALLVGEFVTIPAWSVTGCVIDQRAATLGSEQAVEVLVQARPEDPTPRWFRLEPTEFSVD